MAGKGVEFEKEGRFEAAHFDDGEGVEIHLRIEGGAAEKGVALKYIAGVKITAELEGFVVDHGPGQEGDLAVGHLVGLGFDFGQSGVVMIAQGDELRRGYGLGQPQPFGVVGRQIAGGFLRYHPGSAQQGDFVAVILELRPRQFAVDRERGHESSAAGVGPEPEIASIRLHAVDVKNPAPVPGEIEAAAVRSEPGIAGVAAAGDEGGALAAAGVEQDQIAAVAARL